MDFRYFRDRVKIVERFDVLTHENCILQSVYTNYTCDRVILYIGSDLLHLLTSLIIDWAVVMETGTGR